MASDNSMQLEELIRRFRERDKRALARLITMVENRSPGVSKALDDLYRYTGSAQVVGFTGAPGAGKSTLVSKLVALYRREGTTVAVLAVDPSSPFSGGAVLGDRIRMGDHYRDEGVYIRSVSTRGSHGGVSRATREIVRVLDAFGFDRILIETVGVGQTELAVMNLAHTTVVVTVPEGGDGIQAMKAGLNEIADVFVVNKADREGAARLKLEIETSIQPRKGSLWRPPVLLTQAANGQGLEELSKAIQQHSNFLREHPDPEAEQQRRKRELYEVLSAELSERAIRALDQGASGELLNQVLSGKINPYHAARGLLADSAAIANLISAAGEQS